MESKGLRKKVTKVRNLGLSKNAVGHQLSASYLIKKLAQPLLYWHLNFVEEQNDF